MPNQVVLPSWTVTAIAAVPRGAAPSYAQGYYERDNGAYRAWDAVAKERDSFTAWLNEEVLAG